MAYTVCKEEQRKNRKRGQAEKMKYEHITEGRFIDRPNRFIAHVEINGQVEIQHCMGMFLIQCGNLIRLDWIGKIF